MFGEFGEWISKNKEWLFSGLGGTVVIGFFVWWLGLFTKGWMYFFPAKSPLPMPTLSLKPAPSIDMFMGTTHILFIDDDVKFKVVNILQTAGWQHTRIVKDVANLNDASVKQTHIFFVDINGVGKKLQFRDEGLGLALALKTQYPEKKVVIYSADTKGERFHEAWKKADTYLAKNADPYEFQQIVEELAMSTGM